MNKTKLWIITILSITCSIFFAFNPVLAKDAAEEKSPDPPACQQKDLNSEVRAALGCGGNTGELDDTIIGILNGVIGLLSTVAVIYIIVGGVGYMTSNGDSSKVKKAKDTIFYAVIGLIICALAATIVNFVISKL